MKIPEGKTKAVLKDDYYNFRAGNAGYIDGYVLITRLGENTVNSIFVRDDGLIGLVEVERLKAIVDG